MEIREEHVEWATVHRMREMLPAEKAEYKQTHCFSIFTSILCWTMQRVRTQPSQTDGIAHAMNALAEDLEKKPFIEFVSLPVRPVIVREPTSHFRPEPLPFNDFSAFHDGVAPFSAFRTLVALRNAVAHGDARRVRPENRNGLLVGYRLLCQELDKKKKVVWEGDVNLNRYGMTEIADRLAHRFCEAIAVDYPGVVLDAQQVQEVR